LRPADGHVYETKLAFQVYTASERLLLRSENAPATALAPLKRGFGRHQIDGEQWRTFVLRTSGHWYLAAERDDIRSELAREIAVGTALPPLLALPLMAGLILVAVGWATRAIKRVADEVERRPADRLDPLDGGGVPRELRGLVQALNRLFQRVSSALEREKRFTADAAHELRTPISALKLHAQNLAAAQEPCERAASARGLERGIDRCERLVTQLLELARLERSGLQLEARPLDLAVVVRQVVADLAPEALAREVEIECVGDAEVPVAGDRVLLAVLARNLIENAIRHGPPRSVVSVRMAAGAGQAMLQVRDAGPGIPAEQRARVFERFHREAPGTTPGSGLGLSIVSRVAELHGARVELLDALGGGLEARVHFPPIQRSSR
jgi:two-component system sensor histidine kinase QseC